MSISPQMTPARRDIFLVGSGDFDLVGSADLADNADLVGNADLADNADLVGSADLAGNADLLVC